MQNDVREFRKQRPLGADQRSSLRDVHALYDMADRVLPMHPQVAQQLERMADLLLGSARR